MVVSKNALTLAFAFASAAGAANAFQHHHGLKGTNVDICHRTDEGDGMSPETVIFRTLSVNKYSLPAHAGHGDWIYGACAGNCEAVCAHAAGGMDPCYLVDFEESAPDDQCHCLTETIDYSCGPGTECVTSEDPAGVCTCKSGYSGDPNSAEGCSRDVCKKVKFEKRVIDPDFMKGFSTFAVDLNNDGLIDVLATERYHVQGRVPYFYWYEQGVNNGQIVWTKHLMEQGEATSQSIIAADFYCDGNIEVLAALHRERCIQLYQYVDASKEFKEDQCIDNRQSQFPVWVLTTDFDGDGDLDVVACSALTGAEVAWYENNGSGTFAMHFVDNGLVNAIPVSVAAADFGSGSKDVVVVALELDQNDDGTTRISPKLWWYHNSGDNLSFTKTLIDEDTSYRVVFAEDLDGDGKIDLVADDSNNGIVWYKNNGSGFEPRQMIGEQTQQINHIAFADFNGDGFKDFATSNNLNGIHWFQNNGNQEFTRHVIDVEPPVSSAYYTSNGVFAVDVNGDGRDDVIGVITYEFQLNWYENICEDEDE